MMQRNVWVKWLLAGNVVGLASVSAWANGCYQNVNLLCSDVIWLGPVPDPNFHCPYGLQQACGDIIVSNPAVTNAEQVPPSVSGHRDIAADPDCTVTWRSGTCNAQGRCVWPSGGTNNSNTGSPSHATGDECTG